MTREAYIVDAVRTPVGRRGGSLASVHPIDMAALVIQGLLERSGAPAAEVDDVIFGCVDAVGPQAGDIARLAWLAAGFPDHVPGVTLDRQCGSSQQAVHFAAQAVLAGSAELVVTGGVQNMSRVPIMSSYKDPLGDGVEPWAGSTMWAQRFGGETISQFRGAELMADRWGISRIQMEAYAIESHRRAADAVDAGIFDAEIVPIGDFRRDETVRRDTSAEKLAALQTLTPGGKLTAGLASQISDGASAVLVASDAAVARWGLTPRARIVHMSVRGGDPVEMLSAPIEATRLALKKAGLTADQIDAVEINEAFASVVLAWLAEIDVDPAKVNPVGGAIALGHPLGATGTKLMTTLLHQLERTGGRYGLQTMCEGGGQANVTIIERL